MGGICAVWLSRNRFEKEWLWAAVAMTNVV